MNICWTYATELPHPLANAKLCSHATEARGCEQFAWSCYLIAIRLEVERSHD